MAEDLSVNHSIIDVAKIHNNKEQLDVAQLLHKKNGLFRYGDWEEANQLTQHLFSKEVSLPSGTWRGVNEGIIPSKSQNDQGVEYVGRIEGHSRIDEYIIDDIVPNPKAYRYQYDNQHMEGLTQDVVDAFIYGNRAAAPNKPTGLQPRFNKKALANVHSNGGSTSNKQTSLYICQFGPGKLRLLYGRNKPGADLIKREDMGKEFIVTDTTTGAGLYKYVTKFHLLMGLCLYDDRAVQRICNIDTTTGTLDIEQLIFAIEQLPDPEDLSNTVIFANRTGRYKIGEAIRGEANIMWTTDKDQYGMPIKRIEGIPVVFLEGISNTEAVVA